jgi:hypothetical protein
MRRADGVVSTELAIRGIMDQKNKLIDGWLQLFGGSGSMW